MPCNDNEITPCFEIEEGLGDDWWSLDNDFRFDTQPGKIRAIELRNSENHYNEENFETIIGAGQALQFPDGSCFLKTRRPLQQVPSTWSLATSRTTGARRQGTTGNSASTFWSLPFDLVALICGSAWTTCRVWRLTRRPSPRVRLAVDSARPTIDSITLNGVPEGSPLSIGDASNLEVILITNDENGFDTSEAAVLHYRVKAGEAEISRGSVLLPDITPFGQQYFWSGSLDLTDSGATTLLPSYTVDVWVSGSDEAGNPYDTVTNAMNDPFASWPMALVGPRGLAAEATSLQWDTPVPTKAKPRR